MRLEKRLCHVVSCQVVSNPLLFPKTFLHPISSYPLSQINQSITTTSFIFLSFPPFPPSPSPSSPSITTTSPSSGGTIPIPAINPGGIRLLIRDFDVVEVEVEEVEIARNTTNF